MREYRKGRVKASDEIKRTLLDLIDRENDKESKKKHPAKWYREEVARELKLADKDNPSLRTYECIIQPIRKALQVGCGQDKPWCLASLSKYPLPLEAIPIILQVQHYVQSHRSPKLVTKPKAGTIVSGPFTIREAKWVARLKFINDIVTLESWAHAYSISERSSDIIGVDLDSTMMDKAILRMYYKCQEKEAPNER